MSQDCVFCQNKKSRGRQNVLTTALHVTGRYALDTTGSIGSFYDAYTDNLDSRITLENGSIFIRNLVEKPYIKLRKVDNSQNVNFLEIFGVEEELRASIALGMAEIKEGKLLLNSYEISPDCKLRLIDYHHMVEEEYLSDEIKFQNDIISTLPLNNTATHMITNVKKGLEFAMLVELDHNEDENKIDSILEKVCEYFSQSETNFLAIEDVQIINHLKPFIFTSINEIRLLTGSKSFSEICQDIHRYIFDRKLIIPLLYKLQLIQCIYSDEHASDRRKYCKLDSSISNEIERIIPLNRNIKYLTELFNNKLLPILSEHLEILTEKIQQDLSNLKKDFCEMQQSLATSVLDYRRGNLNTNEFEKQLKGGKFKLLTQNLETLHETLGKLKEKASFIESLKNEFKMEYISVAKLETKNDNRLTLEKKLKSLNQQTQNYYLLSSDELVNQYRTIHQSHCEQLYREYQKKSSVKIIYADFSYCSYKLNASKVFESKTEDDSHTKESNEINILLIGETGVGKSTFINAFVNYLTFHSFDDAQREEPIVLIPASFLITIGDNFEETLITFGNANKNENHNDSGQSVTQHCQSYRFDIDKNLRVRIIDTPGVGDTRGLEQDNQNIEHILQYITALPHLNAICFLLKPNASRLNGFFRSCFMQLFRFLGPKSHSNIIFCFTNTRATFYTPGNTAPLLRNMLAEFRDSSAPQLLKENTFCFDSESFRYLAITRVANKIIFSEDQKKDFLSSWKFSVEESIRLLTFIKQRPVYQMINIQSITHAQMMITTLVRPILETIRNIERNLILRETKTTRFAIDMSAEIILESTHFCIDPKCKSSPLKIENIWIPITSVHRVRNSNQCDTCQCNLSEHIPILYTMQYEKIDLTERNFYDQIQETKDLLLSASITMTHFLLKTNQACRENPFLNWLELFITEEELLYSEKILSNFNVKLCNCLHQVKKDYITGLNEMNNHSKTIDMDLIYNCIEEVQKCNMISNQMDAIRSSRKMILEKNEHDVSAQYPNMKLHRFQKYLSDTQQQ